MTTGRPKGFDGKKRTEHNGKLSRREEIFVKEYLVDMNAARAAKACGYSERTGGEYALQILRKPLVAAAVQAAVEARNQKCEINAEWVLRRLAEHDRMVQEMNAARMDDIYNEDGSLKPLKEWPEVWHRAAMIKGLEVDEIYQFRAVKVKGANGKHKTIKQRVLVGYTKKVVRNEFVREGRETLRTIGLHVGVGAFKESESSIPRDIKITVEYEEKHGHKETEAPAPEAVKPNGHSKAAD